MAKNKAQKKEILANIQDKISKSKSIVFTKFSNLNVKESEDLRKELKKEEGEYYVSKKTLLDLALKNSQLKIEGLDVSAFEGQVAAVFGYGDEIMPVKVVDKFKKSAEDKIDYLGAILDGELLSAEETQKLASIPSKQELYAKMVGSINAPVSGLVNALSGNLKNIVFVLKAIEEKKA